jgi:RNA polymerase sigma factor (sigma-70 family)
VEGLNERQTELWRESRRRRLVRLCAAVTGDREAAEDLAQETLLEAWRNAHKLRDPSGADRWLAAIARNVCRRWARRRGRELPVASERDAVADVAVEDGLERTELLELLERALGSLPRQTRDVLVQRHVDDASHADIAARLGLSENAVSMRLSRGHDALRRLLTPELDGDGGWRETRVWCVECGGRKLLVRMTPDVAFRCPGCRPERTQSEFRLANPFFASLVGGLVRPTAIRARVAEWAWRYYSAGIEAGTVACTRCDRAVPLRRFSQDRDGRPQDGLFARCDRCGETVSTSVRGLAVCVPEVRRFRSDHPRVRAIPERDVEAGGAPALVVRYESVLGSEGVDVVLARDTLRLLRVTTG